MMHGKSLICCVLFLVVALPLNGFAAGKIVLHPSIGVQVMRNKGRPNQGWSYERAAEISKIENMLEALSVAPGPIETHDGSFKLTSTEMPPGFPRYIYVYKGIIEKKASDGSSSYFIDGKGLEAFLDKEAERVHIR